MGDVPLCMACHLSDRNQAIYDGRVSVDGVDLNVMPLEPSEMFSRFLEREAFDVSELSVCRYLTARDAGRSFTALPVFTLRAFRHGNIFVNPSSDIDEPEELRSKTIGITGYQSTTLLWLKGILNDRYDVSVEDVQWIQGGLHEPSIGTEIDIDLPSDIDLEYSDKPLLERAENGELDALMATKVPDALQELEYLERLFPEYPEIEKAYYQRTGHFPILHAVVIQDSVLEAYPWVAAELFEAFQEAKEIAMENLHDFEESPVALPWLEPTLDEVHRVLGDDYWSYGIEGNEATLRTLTRYAYEQGLTSSRLELQDLFVDCSG